MERNINVIKDEIKYAIQNTTGEDRITAGELAVHADHKVYHQTAPAIRAAVRRLIDEGIPIGSDQCGYFLITEHEQLEDTLEGLQSRCDALQGRITAITKAYHQVVNSRHKDKNLSYKDRCRFYVIYLAETACLPYQAVWAMAYRKLQKLTGIDLVNLPKWYQGSILNYVTNQGIENQLYAVLSGLERVLV